MLTCVRFNLILLKFDIIKLLLCNTNTTTNAYEIKALTRVESEKITGTLKRILFGKIFISLLPYLLQTEEQSPKRALKVF